MEVKRCANCMEVLTSSVCTHCGYDEAAVQQAVYGLKRNTILHGKYLVGNVLGQGGFGITYIGFDMSLEIKVAIKEYFPMGYVSRDCTRSNELTWNNTQNGQELWKKGSENFLKEARRMAKIDVLPEIVRVREIFIENQTSYIVMDYVEGETLKAWLSKNGAMKFSDCMKMMLPLMNSLNEVHSFGLIHRDISPDNIMVLPNGRVRLLDLGAAKDLGIENNGTSQLVTKKGFSPIEQYMEHGKIGTWTDVYALSATIYYCITGKMVPEAVERTMEDTLSFDVPVREKLTEKAKRTLQQGLALKAGDRIQTIGELARQLQEIDTDVQETNTVPEKETVIAEPQPQIPEEKPESPAPAPHAEEIHFNWGDEEPEEQREQEETAAAIPDVEEGYFSWGDEEQKELEGQETNILKSDVQEKSVSKKAVPIIIVAIMAVITFGIMVNNECHGAAVVATAVVPAVVIGFMNLIRSDRWKKAGVVEIVMAAVMVCLMVAIGYTGNLGEEIVFVSACHVAVIIFTNLIRSGRWKKAALVFVEAVAGLVISLASEDTDVLICVFIFVAILSVVHLMRVKDIISK